MKVMLRDSAAFATMLLATLSLAACSTSSRVATGSLAAPDAVNPVADSAVASAPLPEIGQDGAIVTATTFNSGQYPLYPPAQGAPGQYPPGQGYPPGSYPVGAAQPGYPQVGTPAGLQQPAYPPMGDPLAPSGSMVAAADPSFVTLDAVGAPSNVAMRDLSGGLTVQKLLGSWTIVSGADQCRLNLTQTTKTGTSRFRASTPGCAMPGLKVVASWQLAGNQVQLFDENNDVVAQLMLSGNRFIGVLSGGQGISMVG